MMSVARVLRAWWADRSIRDRLALPFVLVMGAVSLFVYLYFPATMERLQLEALEARAQSIGAVTASSVASAVIFEDDEAMRSLLLQAFEAPEVVFARLSDAVGVTLMEVVSPRLPRHGEDEGKGYPFTRVTVPVLHQDRLIGELELSLSRHEVVRSVAGIRAMVETVSLAIFLAGVLAVLIVSRLFTRPLFAIVGAAERIRAGDLSARAALLSNDEVGQLAGSFNVMVDQLQASQSELEAVNRDLELRVEQRTRHLQKEHGQRLRAEEEKYHLERFYEQILDSLPLEIAVFDLDQRFLYLNPSVAEGSTRRQSMLGKTPEEAGCVERFGSEVQERRSRAALKAVETGCLVSVEESFLDRGTDLRHYIRVYSPMVSPSGDVTKVVSYGVDVTNRKAAEEALRESEEKLRQSQKMEAVGRLAGGIAHDFNNLLTVISGHAELLMMELDPEGSDYEEVDQMKRAAGRAATLTRQLLAFSRRQVLQPRLLDTNDVISGVERMLGRLIGEHIELETNLKAGLGRVKADPGQLEQVLMNLAVNARDAMPEGGHLTIETETVSGADAKARWGHPVAEETYVVIAVKDTGNGIADEDQEHIFEPFFTTKRVGQGTGLGLATVYGIVKQSQGFIYVDSRVGVGTVFRVYLPVAESEEEVRSTRLRAGAGAMARGTETILLVEDEAMVRKLTERILERAGYHVLSAAGPFEALGVVKNHSGPIHLLFTDVVMPGMPGHELAAKVQSLRESIKVLFMSGYTDNALLYQGVLETGIVLLQKPFTTRRVTQVVRSVLDGVETDGGGAVPLRNS